MDQLQHLTSPTASSYLDVPRTLKVELNLGRTESTSLVRTHPNTLLDGGHLSPNVQPYPQQFHIQDVVFCADAASRHVQNMCV